jgi:ribosomal protein L19E
MTEPAQRTAEEAAHTISRDEISEVVREIPEKWRKNPGKMAEKSRKIKKNNSQPWPPQNGPPGGSLRPRVEKSQNWILKIPD